ncbi:MAG: hypothetical protein IPN86_15850 [Saprospiraceae bacterium]|nr:hypothetical protein [Saprospiraceae bacterium]
MRYFKYLITITILYICSINETFSQSRINFAEINLTYLNPNGYFGNNVNDNLGFEFGYLRQLKEDKPLFWGISLYYNRLDKVSETLLELVDFQLLDIDYSTTSNLLGLNGKMRFYPNIYLGKLEWYLEAQLGYKWLFTNTTKTLSSDSDSSDTSTEEGSLSLTYGISTGLNYPINEATFINARLNYLPGLSVPYYIVNPNNEIFESTIDKFDLKNSTTDILRWDFGITYRF